MPDDLPQQFLALEPKCRINVAWGDAEGPWANRRETDLRPRSRTDIRDQRPELWTVLVTQCAAVDAKGREAAMRTSIKAVPNG